jgi:hypothetical protein
MKIKFKYEQVEVRVCLLVENVAALVAQERSRLPPSQNQQTPNSKQFKPPKDMLLNSSVNAGKSWPHGRVMHFRSGQRRSLHERTTVNGEQLKPFN